MEMQREHQELLTFLEEYAEFLAHMLKDEQEKLQALLSNSLPRMEHAISLAQANAKQLENLETRRELLQAQAGFADLPFSGILRRLPEEERPSFQAIFDRLGKYLNEIKFHNEKSMGVARANVRTVDPEALLPDEPGKPGGADNPYLKARAQAGRVSILETKI